MTPLSARSGLGERLRVRIGAEGPLPFEDFMAACLYDPAGGFFTTGELRSVEEGDFLTSPEVSPWFGRMLARFVATEAVGERLLVVDAGAGSGSLLRPLIAGLGRDRYDFHAVEVSPAARAALGEVVGPDRVHVGLDGLPEGFDGVVIANELLDNLPVALAIRSGDGWVERWVGSTGDRLGLVTVEARPDVVAWCDAFAGTVPEGGMVEVELAASRWVADALAAIATGALVVIDYGGTAEELEPRRTQGTLRTYRKHHLGPDPLTEPGATDVTVDVNFTAMLAAAETAGAQVELVRQDDFLEELGLRRVVADLRARELELARASEHTMERLKVRSEKTNAETLLHPRGLGDFRVMVAMVAAT